MKSILVVLFFLVIISFTRADDGDNPPPILPLQICQNKVSVKGIWVTVTNPNQQTGQNESRRVASFRGLRFANKPERFSAPTGFDLCSSSSSSSIIDATNFAPMCTQVGNDGVTVEGSEDCLFLNVYVPEAIYDIILTKTKSSSSSSNALFPVSHYIYGGSLTSGNSAWEPHEFFSAFCGDSANDPYGCIAITSNYRLSILGFLMTPAFGKDVNFGISDQILSLKWTQKFVSSFGGDPSTVTVSGQSSGGTSVFALMASPLVKGLFRSAFSMSGSPNITLDRNAKILQDFPIIKSLGCMEPNNIQNASEQIACLRKIPVQTLFNAVPNSWSTPGIWDLGGLTPTGRDFAGLVFVDGNIVAVPFRDAIRIGLNENVTLLIQNEGQECNDISPHFDVRNYSQLEWRQKLQFFFSKWGETTSQKMAMEFYNLYEKESVVNPQLAYASINTDYGITCASPNIGTQFGFEKWKLENNNNVHQHLQGSFNKKRAAPLYISINQWPPETPNDFKVTSMAYHQWDYFAAIHYWYPFWYYRPSLQDYKIGKLIRQSWYHLMKYGTLKNIESPVKWLPIDEGVDAFPSEYNMFVYSRPDRFPFLNASGMVKNYKQKQCQAFFEYGLNERFWWVN